MSLAGKVKNPSGSDASALRNRGGNVARFAAQDDGARANAQAPAAHDTLAGDVARQKTQAVERPQAVFARVRVDQIFPSGRKAL